jgi:hypothetical protein
MTEWHRRWISIRMTAGLLWWAIALPSNRFIPRLLGFCRSVLEDAESSNPMIKAHHEAQRQKPTKH